MAEKPAPKKRDWSWRSQAFRGIVIQSARKRLKVREVARTLAEPHGLDYLEILDARGMRLSVMPAGQWSNSESTLPALLG